MSYDLYFYKRQENTLELKDIRNYLNSRYPLTDEKATQWFIEYKDTRTYFTFELNEPDEEDGHFAGFEYLYLSFNLNFLRPDFFGIHAFEFVDYMISDLDLYVLNPQSNAEVDLPAQPLPSTLYKNWSDLNAKHAADLGKQCELVYCPAEKSNDFYFYNLNRSKFQDELGDNYYVPQLTFLKTKSDAKVITMCIWPEHIPYLFPQADYYLLSKNYKKFFRSVKESGLISSKTFIENFGSFLDDFRFKDCSVIHPENAEKAANIFNSVPFEYQLEDFADGLPIEKIVNVVPV